MKGKGKIHPSPPPHDALAVLGLLPAAILALTAALREEDKEVLAYLLTRSIDGPAAAAEERRHCRRPGSATQHLPVFGCGCFDCYTGFWSRWDCSPDRELIHQAIEAFEEHLASAEKKGARGRRAERKAAERAVKGKGKKGKEKEKVRRLAVEADKAQKQPEEAEKPLEVTTPGGSEGFASEEAPVGAGAGAATKTAAAEEEEEGVEAEAANGERRRGWADVMGMFHSRLWSLWGPGA
ncbi:unnamed protein product [Musa acuminata subsp. malaccensis]|uniref:(wild Malaysian banana) hypothetical protein n=1 Tax=Musa acuminata subsp. malaccensis TaxID=214687 RepID=A0A804KGT3_MUSAM|nr:PREDICTED: uncharacterized protein LOC103997154 [Musa acuminata subsp. malaccensis]CAG1834426.1 unnamed protein product [Musa acuminata subsp. malaccensis]